MKTFSYNSETKEATFAAFDETVTLTGLSFNEANGLSYFIDLIAVYAKNQALKEIGSKLYNFAESISETD